MRSTLIPLNPGQSRRVDPEPSRRAAISPEFTQECVGFFSEVVHVLGVPRSVGQIYGLLFASPQPLSFADIVGRIGLSKV